MAIETIRTEGLLRKTQYHWGKYYYVFIVKYKLNTHFGIKNNFFLFIDLRK